ncbi:hypothetical protein GCM10007094_40550 [Pseudovibrio japonicus]|uniref:Uncharacterized protein n=1 Tax=Pseudovibrio japonicus TaxID=366534 RepID=A0ABQ3EMI2_9HYPH|nr:hypothetical protein GCM10007094_40550 [Pseudovibrio japonicus]
MSYDPLVSHLPRKLLGEPKRSLPEDGGGTPNGRNLAMRLPQTWRHRWIEMPYSESDLASVKPTLALFGQAPLGARNLQT